MGEGNYGVEHRGNGGDRTMIISSRRAIVGGAIASVASTLRPSRVDAFVVTPSLSDSLVVPAARWLIDHFGDTFSDKVKGTSVTRAVLCAIACQESGYRWFRKKVRDNYSPEDVLRLMVLDEVEPRGTHTYPRTMAVFMADPRYSDLAPEMIATSDASLEAAGYKKSGKLNFGYGLLQYDLQKIEHDEAFWRTPAPKISNSKLTEVVGGLWGDIGACTDRVMKELDETLSANHGNLSKALVAYNGSGQNAITYGRIVSRFSQMIAASKLTN